MARHHKNRRDVCKSKVARPAGLNGRLLPLLAEAPDDRAETTVNTNRLLADISRLHDMGKRVMNGCG